MRKKETLWKLDRPYDPDKRAKALRDQFARYRKGSGATSGGKRGKAIPVTWVLVACLAGLLIVQAT